MGLLSHLLNAISGNLKFGLLSDLRIMSDEPRTGSNCSTLTFVDGFDFVEVDVLFNNIHIDSDTYCWGLLLIGSTVSFGLSSSSRLLFIIGVGAVQESGSPISPKGLFSIQREKFWRL